MKRTGALVDRRLQRHKLRRRRLLGVDGVDEDDGAPLLGGRRRVVGKDRLTQ